jgi:DNA-binding transcriptional ArsR family regulator
MRDDPAVRRAIEQGQDVEVEASAYAQDDFLLEFLMSSGLWELLVSSRPRRLRKDNGRPWRAMNGLEVLRELARVERIARCGRVISDARLMVIAGFNAEQVGRARRRGGLVVTPETLSHHLSRIAPQDAVAGFYGHVSLLREKGWVGRGVYAADAHDITFPHARGWPGMGKVGEAHGYKLLLLVRAAPGTERIVGFALAPLPTSEHLLLRMVLREIERRVCPVRKLIDVLVMDRGYWGADFLLSLRRRHGVHFVTRAQHEGLGVVADTDALVADQEPLRVCEERSRLGRVEVRLRGAEKVPLFDDTRRELGTVNVVVADEMEPSGRPLLHEDGTPRRVHYVTSLPVLEDLYAVRGHYRLRWTVENQGFRNLTQRWSLDVPAGRNFAAIVARLCVVLVLANAEALVAELFPGPWQEERDRLARLGSPGRIGGRPALAAYTDDGRLGVLGVEDYAALVAARERRRLATEILAATRRGEDVEQLLLRLASPRTPD